MRYQLLHDAAAIASELREMVAHGKRQEADDPEGRNCRLSSSAMAQYRVAAKALENLVSRFSPLPIDRNRVTVKVVVECNREHFPGWGYDPQDMADAAAAAVEQKLSSYAPETTEKSVRE